jgi:hypothetical protein
MADETQTPPRNDDQHQAEAARKAAEQAAKQAADLGRPVPTSQPAPKRPLGQ